MAQSRGPSPHYYSVGTHRMQGRSVMWLNVITTFERSPPQRRKQKSLRKSGLEPLTITNGTGAWYYSLGGRSCSDTWCHAALVSSRCCHMVAAGLSGL